MKISKLFHWLYALVMLLPIFAIGVTCGYAMFNKNAYLSNSENNYELVNINDIPNYSGKMIFSLGNIEFSDTSGNNILNVEDFKSNNAYINDDEVTNILLYSNIYNNVQSMYLVFRNSSNTSLFNINIMNNNIFFECNLLSYQKQYNNTNLGNFADGFYKYDISENSYLNNIFYYSVDKVTESPLFSWAYNSFLVAPFAYIVGLFSMPTNSPVVMLLSYWLAISIIWLVFDLIMYVPLLVHRWIDKGVIE